MPWCGHFGAISAYHFIGIGHEDRDGDSDEREDEKSDLSRYMRKRRKVNQEMGVHRCHFRLDSDGNMISDERIYVESVEHTSVRLVRRKAHKHLSRTNTKNNYKTHLRVEVLPERHGSSDDGAQVEDGPEDTNE
jgi:hypothetical protein